MHRLINSTLGQAKRAAIAVIGFTILGIGFALLVLPGPALLVIPVGLAVLASEFLWARKLLVFLRERIERRRQGKHSR
jgi:urea transporter